MKNRTDLTKGNILVILSKLALPVMLTSMIQMAYNMIDMIWIGRLGSNALAGVGSASFVTWFGISLAFTAKTGSEITVSQSLGRNNLNAAKHYASNALTSAIYYSLFFGVTAYLLAPQIINFFKLSDAEVLYNAISYLRVMSIACVFGFLNPVYSGIYNGAGNSRTPFYVNSIGLIINIFLDPLLIFGWGPIPGYGAVGAAMATVFSQMLVFVIITIKYTGHNSPLGARQILVKLEKKYLGPVVKLGLPISLQFTFFSIFATFLARILSNWGAMPIAVQKVGIQLEAISWMTASGFSSALSAFTGQNWGAAQLDRIKKGFWAAMGIMGVWGIITSAIFIIFARPLFRVFLPEAAALDMGVTYLQILGVSQLFMCIEISACGAFNGLSKTMPPVFIGVTLTGLRVPIAMILSADHLLGLSGVWWSISATSIAKGLLLFSWYLFRRKRYLESHELAK